MALPSVIDEINRLFDELVRRPWGSPAHAVSPAVVREVEDGWVVTIPVEGLRAEDVKVHVEGRRLIVRGHRHTDEKRRHGSAGWSHWQQEQTLEQLITLPVEPKREDLEVRHDGKHLTVHIHRRTP